MPRNAIKGKPSRPLSQPIGKRKDSAPQSQPKPLPQPRPQSTPTKKRKEDLAQATAKKQRIEEPQDDSNDDSNDNIVFESPLRHSTSRSTLSNDVDDDDDDAELEQFEEEAALMEGASNATLTGGSNTQTQASGSKPVKNKAVKAPSKEAAGRHSTISPDTRVTFDELATRCRLVYLAKFRMVPHATIIRSVWGENIVKGGWEWEESNNRISWNGTNWKLRSIQNMQIKIREYIKNDKTKALESTSEIKPLAKFFASKYSPSAFSWVFEFTNGCVDITESDKNEKLHFYFKNIWINFGARVKLYMDWAADPNALFNDANSRQSLLIWITVMAKSTRYDFEIDDFVRIEAKERRHRNGAAGPVEPDLDANYMFLGTPPPEG